MASNNYTNMDMDSFNNLFKNISNNFDKVRGHSLAQSAHCPRTPLLSLSDCNKDYATRVQKASNRMDEDDSVTTSNSIQLVYTNSKGQNSQVSNVADNTSSTCQQCTINKIPALNQLAGNNVVNIQLNYDIGQALDPESWDGDFYAISLHRSMEYLASDTKIIKDSPTRM